MYTSRALLLLLGTSLGLASPVLDKRATTCPADETGISTAESNAVVSAFKKSAIIPDVIESITPAVQLFVDYGGKEVNLGNTFTVGQTAKQPTVKFTAEDGYDPYDTKYSFFVIDPDVPAKNGVAGAKETFLVWQKAHVHPECVTGKRGRTATGYLPPAPVEDQHRYVFLIYREPQKYVPDGTISQLRPGFNVTTYTKRRGLELVGGNYFLEAITL